QPNQWNAAVTVNPEAEVAANTAVGLEDAPVGPSNFIVEFTNLGTLRRVADAAGNLSPEEGAISINIAFDVPGAAVEPGAEPVRQTFALNLGTAGSVRNAVTQFAEASSTRVFEQDGYSMGYLETFKIDQSGVITAVYSNGSSRTIGQMALASFTNPGGLEKAGETNFLQSNNSGLADIGPSGIAGKGKIIAGTLEMSNVDLAEQFTDMIVTQRGFQANSRTIQTSDQMLQELLTLKR
ncbi:MAG TPA: flagellar hook-basal body complex protein, partial [Magnetospirillaceae bacterium]|nr:flagellar hook-basal body complex protein [Magnetospirillaceae bacterium]